TEEHVWHVDRAILRDRGQVLDESRHPKPVVDSFAADFPGARPHHSTVEHINRIVDQYQRNVLLGGPPRGPDLPGLVWLELTPGQLERLELAWSSIATKAAKPVHRSGQHRELTPERA